MNRKEGRRIAERRTNHKSHPEQIREFIPAQGYRDDDDDEDGWYKSRPTTSYSKQ